DTTTTNSTTSSTANTTSSTNSSTASTSSTGGGGGTGTEDIAEFCQSTVDPFCEALFACCTDPTELAQWGGTVEACKTQTMTECETDLENELGPLYAMGLTDLDPDRLAACVSTLESLAAGACTEPPQLALFLCYTSFEGKVPAGQGCGAAGNDISWAECEEGYCDSGSCVAFLASNAPCTPGSDPAEYCNFTEGEWCLSATNTCGPRLAAGQPCLAVPENPECLSMSCPAGQCELPDAQQLCAEGG
ncbi:MAG TPA: hypothetical protein VFB62_25705, partial [Polyangiaceae bacterium]|nr:hypothetical protein [Polyangiaceae bacterium]